MVVKQRSKRFLLNRINIVQEWLLISFNKGNQQQNYICQ